MMDSKGISAREAEGILADRRPALRQIMADGASGLDVLGSLASAHTGRQAVHRTCGYPCGQAPFETQMMKPGRGRARRAAFLSNNIFMQSKGLHCDARSVTEASPGAAMARCFCGIPVDRVALRAA
jgi:hypothetical protein